MKKTVRSFLGADADQILFYPVNARTEVALVARCDALRSLLSLTSGLAFHCSGRRLCSVQPPTQSRSAAQRSAAPAAWQSTLNQCATSARPLEL